ncbi:MAG: DNA gyrase inhibitor YacG [Paracoccaceae bacterium]
MSCPICQRPADPRYRPFCSKRCADVDLGRWLTGAYAIPAAAEEEPPEAPADESAKPVKPH